MQLILLISLCFGVATTSVWMVGVGAMLRPIGAAMRCAVVILLATHACAYNFRVAVLSEGEGE